MVIENKIAESILKRLFVVHVLTGRSALLLGSERGRTRDHELSFVSQYSLASLGRCHVDTAGKLVLNSAHLLTSAVRLYGDPGVELI